MLTQQTTHTDGLVEITKEPQKITLSFEHALTEYGNGPKCGIHIQVPVGVDSPPKEIQGLVKSWAEFAETHVYSRLGVPVTVENGRVTPELAISAPKPARGGGTTQKPAASSGPRQSIGDRIEDGWKDLTTNPNGWWDNREGKKNPKAPDFKATKDNAKFGGDKPFGLWIESPSGESIVPEWVDLGSLSGFAGRG